MWLRIPILLPAASATLPLTAAEFAFISCSDIHYEGTAEPDAGRFAAVEMLDSLPGTAWPAEFGGGTVDEPLATGAWHRLAATRDGTRACLSVDGGEVARAAGKGTIDARSRLLRFGSLENRHQPCVPGELRIPATARPAGWFGTCWKNQSAPGRFRESGPLR